MSKTVAVKISDALIKLFAKDPRVGTFFDLYHSELVG